MDWASIGSLIGLVIALGTFIYGAFGLRGKARKDYTDLLQTEVTALRVSIQEARAALAECEQRAGSLRSEIEWLRQRLMERDAE